MLVAESIQELSRSLATWLRSRSLSQTYAAEFAEALAAEYASLETPPSNADGFHLVFRHYVIRKDDLRIFEAVATGLTASAGVHFFTESQPLLQANVAIGLALVRLARTLMLRGVLLDDDTLHVLTILRWNVKSPNDPGLSVEDIVQIIRRTKPAANNEWVEQKLLLLSQIPTYDGGRTSLASKDSSGLWRSHA